ncbi:hypothetical protein H072_749 [Dactylellina haptotyla CBS 200.50]|uniref:Uncharacterized protein n=1 Tax=Dactylellina haptotyla (strain CBS 200.50) TaxID=1284197 RepID=S8CBY1_DACHA|nr:hypothetical protein H072_749 [Dactylellina haptotyla CBS 200.50]
MSLGLVSLLAMNRRRAWPTHLLFLDRSNAVYAYIGSLTTKLSQVQFLHVLPGQGNTQKPSSRRGFIPNWFPSLALCPLSDTVYLLHLLPVVLTLKMQTPSVSQTAQDYIDAQRQLEIEARQILPYVGYPIT